MKRIEFLLEEPSSEEALRHIIPKLDVGKCKIEYRNLGSKYKLLKQLPQRLAAYRAMIDKGDDVRIVVLVDRDNDECQELKRTLESHARNAGLRTKSAPDVARRFHVVNRIAIEELESWFLGDLPALRRAFSSLPSKLPRRLSANPDNVSGGTWEALHSFLKNHGIYRNSYPKIEAARKIAPHLDIENNRSRSFRVFISGVKALAAQ